MGIKRSVAGGVANALSLGLRAGGRPFYRFMLDALWERQPFFEPALQEPMKVELFYPGYVTPPAETRPLAERILAAYGKAKAAQLKADPIFLPSSAWQTVIDGAFEPLASGLANRDVDRFHHFLANFRSWKLTTGMEPSQQISEYARDPRRRAHFEQRIVQPLISWWLRSESYGRDISALTIPRHGNQCGVMVDGEHLIAPSSIFCEVYGRLLAGFVATLNERTPPVIAELGAGFGKLFYFTAKNLPEFRFMDFDLPESLACAAYFLAQAFPEKRLLLYGEGELTEQSLAQYDFILFPSFEIGKLPDRSVALFVNENSLGVVAPEACRLLVGEICRSTKAFYHRNTETSRLEFDDGTRSLVNSEYPVPREEFDEVARYCDVSRMMASGRLNFDNDMYWYYYRRKDV